MDPILAAIADLEQKQGDILVALFALRKIAGQPVTTEARITLAPEMPTPKPARVWLTKREQAARSKPMPAPAPAKVPGLTLDERILDVLKKGPASPKSLRAAIYGPTHATDQALKALQRRGVIVCTGATTATRWALKPAKASSGPVLETVWNGTKDAKGEAPSLVSDQPRKAG